jgi:hypothetical protein
MSKQENVFFVSMMRSGHHAVLNWFARNQLRPIVHFNDCRIDSGALRPDPPNLVMFYNGFYSKYLLNEPLSILHDLTKNSKTTIFSFEERDPKYILKATEIVRPAKIIIVVRDALNFIASCMKHAEQYPQVKAKIIDTMSHRLNIWLSHARELQEGSKGNRYVINYNFWFSKKPYRDALASRYGFANHDIGIEEVLLFGNGSSFDGLNYDANATRMGVLTRWEEYRNNPQFRSYISPEVADLSRSLFEIDYSE